MPHATRGVQHYAVGAVYSFFLILRRFRRMPTAYAGRSNRIRRAALEGSRVSRVVRSLQAGTGPAFRRRRAPNDSKACADPPRPHPTRGGAALRRPTCPKATPNNNNNNNARWRHPVGMLRPSDLVREPFDSGCLGGAMPLGGLPWGRHAPRRGASVSRVVKKKDRAKKVRFRQDILFFNFLGGLAKSHLFLKNTTPGMFGLRQAPSGPCKAT